MQQILWLLVIFFYKQIFSILSEMFDAHIICHYNSCKNTRTHIHITYRVVIKNTNIWTSSVRSVQPIEMRYMTYLFSSGIIILIYWFSERQQSGASGYSCRWLAHDFTCFIWSPNLRRMWCSPIRNHSNQFIFQIFLKECKNMKNQNYTERPYAL